MLLAAPIYTKVIAMSMVLFNVMMPIAMAEEEGEHERGSRPATAVTNEKWKNECGACHVAYPPRFLPAESWRALMSGLDKHFGSDASLDAQTAREISDFLVQNAGRGKSESTGKPLLRISDTRWFKREHGEVAQHTWSDPAVKSPANCPACHTRAESGDYSENGVRIPGSKGRRGDD